MTQYRLILRIISNLKSLINWEIKISNFLLIIILIFVLRCSELSIPPVPTAVQSLGVQLLIKESENINRSWCSLYENLLELTI